MMSSNDHYNNSVILTCTEDPSPTKELINAINPFIERRLDESLNYYLPEYDIEYKNNVCMNWYEDLSNHMKGLFEGSLSKKEACLRLYINKDTSASTKRSSIKPGKQRNPKSEYRMTNDLLLGVVDSIGSFTITLNKNYIETLSNLSFIQKIKYERKKRQYEDSLNLTLSNL